MNHSDFQSLDADEVAACPECDRAAVAICNMSSIPGPEKTTPRYKCDNCNEKFDSFVVRERNGPTYSGVSGLAKQLLDADPSDV